MAEKSETGTKSQTHTRLAKPLSSARTQLTPTVWLAGHSDSAKDGLTTLSTLKVSRFACFWVPSVSCFGLEGQLACC